jgi:CHAT domain-containing protein/Tfp pilus assembly protein PilF
LELSEASGDKIGQALNHGALAEILAYKGDPEGAFKHLNIAEPLVKESGDPKQQANFFRISGAAYLASGAFDQAIAAYQQALPILRSLNDRGGQAEMMASMGWIYQSLGDVQRALKNYENALSLFLELKNVEAEARTRLAMGFLFQSLGEEVKAAEQYTRVCQIGSDSQIAAVLANVGQYRESHNKFMDALASYEEALKLAQSAHDRATEAGVLAGMGRCYTGLNELEKGEKLLVQARRLMKETGSRDGEAGVVASLGEIGYRYGIMDIARSRDPKSLFDLALKYYDKALSLMRAAGNRAGEIGVLTNTGILYDAWNKPRQALEYYTQALQELDDLLAYARIEDLRMDLTAQSANLYGRAILLEVSQNRINEAFDLSERARARAFLDQLGNKNIDIRAGIPAEFSLREAELRKENISLERQIGQELSKPLGDVNSERINALQLRLSIVRTDYENLLTRLKLSNPKYASLVTASPLTHTEAQRQLEPDTTLVSYFTTPEMTLAFIVTRENIRCVKLHVTGRELSAAVSTFLDFSGGNNAPSSLKQLYKWLIAPIKSELRTSLVGIVPHGVLNNLPFASLTSDGKQYFGDTHEIFSLPSVSVLPYVKTRKKPDGNRIFVLANDEQDGLPHLGHAYGEARAVASLFGAEPLLGEAATASALRTNAGQYDILHLIGHIDPNTETPQFARIMLAPGETDDGSLDLHQVYDLDLRNTNLVVLSGCQSQLGPRSRGDDIVGLNRAFLYAGTASVIASLWSVDDEASQELMTAFYGYLKQGLTKAESLRAAQKDVRRKHPNPYYWAAFVLTGDPGVQNDSGLAVNSGVPKPAKTE